MASEPAAPGTVRDRRTFPRGVIPKHAQTWLLVGLAVVIVIVIATTGHTTPPATASLVPPPVASEPNAAQVTAYADRLRALSPQPAPQPAIDPRAPVSSAAPAYAPSEPPAASVPDRIEEDRKRKEYESLFASNVVVSRRPGDVLSPAAASIPDSGAAGVPALPSLDAVAQAVARASGYAPAAPQPPMAAPPTSAPGAPQAARVTPPGQHRVFEGTVIDAVLANRLDGGAAGPVNALITTAVYAQDLTLVIPAGARVLGRAARVEAFGESRLAVSFHRVVLPNGRDVSLDQFAGMNQLGDVGLKDQVNHHYLSTFGAAAAVGVISGLAQRSAGGFGGSDGSTVVITGSVGDAASQATAQALSRFLNRLPTITIREGHRVAVYITSDLDLPAYGGTE